MALFSLASPLTTPCASHRGDRRAFSRGRVPRVTDSHEKPPPWSVSASPSQQSNRSHTPTPIHIVQGAVLLLSVLLAACASSTTDPKPLSTGLDALESSEPEHPAEVPIDPATQAKLDLMAQALRNSEVSVDAAPASRPSADRPAPLSSAEPTETAPEPSAPAETVEPRPAPAVPSKESLIADLGERLREQARTSSAPAAALLRLAALELLEPNAGEIDPAAEASLTPQETEFLRAWRTLFASARDGLDSSGDLSPLIEQVVSLAERVQASQPLALLDSRLCTKVDGFGMFDEVDRHDPAGTYTLIAGKRHRAIVYIEVSNYTHEPRQRRGVDGFEVRLSQELALHHLASNADTIVWQRPFQDITDFSRKRRRDFFTTQIIDFPPTFGVGSYRLKITISDKPAGAIAEAVIPIEFVAEKK